MTDESVRTILSRQAKLEGQTPEEMTAQVTAAMQLGLARFWNARPWSFRRYEYTLTTTTSAGDYAMPNDTGAIGEVRDVTVSTGYSITVLPKDEFDRRFPKPEYYPVEVPAYAALWIDDAAVDPDKKKIRFFPRPSGTRSFKIDIFRDTPASWVPVPDKFSDVALLIASKFFLKSGSLEAASAEQEIQLELNRLDTDDSLYRSRPSVMMVEFPMSNAVSNLKVPWS